MSKLKIPSILIAVAIGLYLIFGWILKAQNPVMMNGGGGGGSGTANQALDDIAERFDGGGIALAGTATRCKEVSFGGTITGVFIEGDQSGSITIDVLTVAHSSYTGPGSASSITSAAIPALSSAARYTDTTLTGWTTSLTAGSSVCFSMSSPTTVTWASISLRVAKN